MFNDLLSVESLHQIAVGPAMAKSWTRKSAHVGSAARAIAAGPKAKKATQIDMLKCRCGFNQDGPPEGD
jgi:hypothetical protein